LFSKLHWPSNGKWFVLPPYECRTYMWWEEGCERFLSHTPFYNDMFIILTGSFLLVLCIFASDNISCKTFLILLSILWFFLQALEAHCFSQLGLLQQKYYRTDGLNNRILFITKFEDWEVWDQSASMVHSGEAFPWLPISHYVLTWWRDTVGSKLPIYVDSIHMS
jgi:hypothetical protein